MSFERTQTDETAWVFVSHASADLRRVRQVRNYLEDKGAGPILFHLRSLKHAVEFWPLIEREIQSRNFFLYCDSPAARESEWVRRERDAVEALSQTVKVTIGSIDVTAPEIDRSQLDAFLSKTRVFASYAVADYPLVLPFIRELERNDFQVFDQRRDLTFGSFKIQLQSAIAQAASDGFIVAFISANSLRSPYAQAEVSLALQLNARVVPVLLDGDINKLSDPFASSIQILNGMKAFGPSSKGPADLVRSLLGR